jgi:hypothetical protein
LYLIQREDEDEVEVRQFNNLTLNITTESSVFNVTDAGLEAIPPTLLVPPSNFAQTAKSNSTIFYGVLVGLLCSLAVYITGCTLLYCKIRSANAAYNVTTHYTLTDAGLANDESSSTIILPSWLQCLTWVWKVGTCNCCFCLARACVHTSRNVVRSQRIHYA